MSGAPVPASVRWSHGQGGVGFTYPPVGSIPIMGLNLRPGRLERYRQVATLLARHGMGDLVRSAKLDSVLDDDVAEGDPNAAERLADDLESMGATWVKLGQLLSSRVDLLPPAYVDALARLQDEVEPFDADTVQRIIEDELGVRLSAVFPTFDPEPVAAASLGQVHRATLRDGREVVVKVQRPGIREEVLEDVEVLEDLTTFLEEHTELGQRHGIRGLFEQFRGSLMDELDYRREARNLDTIRRSLEDNDLVVVPAPLPDLTSGRVLTMEYLPGRNVTDLGPLARLDLDGAPLADALFRAYLRQVIVDGVFHADPHPGNVLVTDDGRLALVDVGMVARLTPGVRDRLVKLFLALLDANDEEVARIAVTLGEPLPSYDPAAFQQSVTEVLGRVADASIEDVDIGAMVLELTRRAADTGLRMDVQLVMLGKAMLNLDQVAVTLDPTFEPRDALRRHADELMQQSMGSSPAAILSTLLEAKEFMEALPGRLNRAMDAVGSGRFELRVNAFDEDEFLRGLHKLANVIAGGLILAALIVASAFLAGSGGEGGPGNRIGLVIFVLSSIVGLGMLLRIWLQSRNVRAHRPDR